MSTMTPPTPQPGGLPPAKKLGPLAWVLIGCGGLIVVAGLVAVGVTFFVAQKLKDPTAIAKLAFAGNPDIEVLNVDKDRGIITVRDKKQNKTLTLNFEDVKKGKIVFQEDGKDAVTMETRGDGSSGGINIKTAEGSMQIGGNVKTPAWVPVYPGATPEGTFGASGDQEEAGSFHFTVKDSLDKVASWYADELKKAGFKVTSNIMQQDGKASGGVVGGEDAAQKRNVAALLGSEAGGTSVNVTYSVKK